MDENPPVDIKRLDTLLNSPQAAPNIPSDGTEGVKFGSWHTDHVVALFQQVQRELRQRHVPLEPRQAPEGSHTLTLNHKELCTVLTALSEHGDALKARREKSSPFGLTVHQIQALYAQLTDIYEDA
jgi:hypothetical protein